VAANRFPPTAGPPPVAPFPLPLHVLLADEDLLVVNKPAGLVVHPCRGERRRTLVNAVAALARAEGREGWRHHLAGRLDRDTSGIVVLARSERARRSLHRQRLRGVFEKRYRAILVGAPPAGAGTWDAPIGRSPLEWPRWNVRAGGRPAVTEYEVEGSVPVEIPGRWILPPPWASRRAAGHGDDQIGEGTGDPVDDRPPIPRGIPQAVARRHVLDVDPGTRASLAAVVLRPRTGRTHQIRIHAAYHGTPVLGDPVYGAAARNPGVTWLHAFEATLRHPADNEPLRIRADRAPDDDDLTLPL
jgi:23S rRNA-/tRNA-specific pseudouridylate synthase